MNDEKLLREYGFDIAVQTRAKSYLYATLRLKSVRYALLAAGFVAFAAFGSHGLASALGCTAGSGWGANALYALVFTVGFLLVDLPFDLWGYALERRFGLSNQQMASFFSDWLKSATISAIILVGSLPSIYIGMRDSSYWWLIAWAIATIIIIFMGFISPVLLMPLFFKFEPLADDRLVGRLKELAERAGVKVLGVFKMAVAAKTSRAIGALTGIGATRRIILSDTLLDNYTEDEIETVIAHELGHHAHKDIWKGIVTFSLMGLIGLLAVRSAIAPFSRLLGLSEGIETLPLFLLIIGGVFTLLKPVFNTISRGFEGAADEYALELAHKPEAQARVDVKLCDQNLRYAAPHPIVEFLFYDHPAGIKRVRRALRFAGKAAQNP